MQRITEQAAYLAGNGTVDRAAKVIRGVRICGPKSRNKNRRYESQCMKDVAPRMIGRRVFVDHVKDPNERKIQNRSEFARIIACQDEPDGGLRGDLKYFESCASCEHILEIIEDKQDAPGEESPYTGSIGLSPVWYADAKHHAGEEVVSRIHDIESVDIVTFPATTRSIREHIEVHPMTWKKYIEGRDDKLRPAFLKLVEEYGMGDTMMPADASDHNTDLLSAIEKLISIGDDASKKKIKKIMAIIMDNGEEEKPEVEPKGDDEKDDEPEPKKEDAAETIARLRRENTVIRECQQFGYDPTDKRLAVLVGIEDKDERTQLIRESADLDKRKAARSESPGKGNGVYKTAEETEQEALTAAKNRIKNDA
jgi:hypothetical protein